MMNKFEARNPKFETISNDQNRGLNSFVLRLGHSNFGFVSDFDIRISNFERLGFLKVLILGSCL